MVTLIFAVVCCGLYPLAVYGIAQVCSPARPTAASSWTTMARCTAQNSSASNSPPTNIFSRAPRRRATATTPPVPAAATSARPRQTWSPPSPSASPITARKTAGDQRARARRRRDRIRQRPRPAHQPANAALQIPRVAKARGLSEERVRELVQQTPMDPTSASSVNQCKCPNVKPVIGRNKNEHAFYF